MITIDLGVERLAEGEVIQEAINDDIPVYNIFETPPNPETLKHKKELDEREQKLLTVKKWMFKPLYKQQFGRSAPSVWYVIYDEENHVLEKVSGMIGGALRSVKQEVKLNESGRGYHEQAVLEARSLYVKKYRNDLYYPAGEPPPLLKEPMLASKYEPNMKLNFPVIVQPKLDGARCIVRIINGEVEFRSRGNKKFCHLNNEFGDEISKFMSYLPFRCQLDGEVYIHGVSFSKFTEALKNVNKKVPLLSKAYYMIFDLIVDNVPARERHQIAEDAFRAYRLDGNSFNRFRVVRSFLANSHEEIAKAHRIFRENGFEGTIIRKCDAFYKPRTGTCMLKLKDIQDAEGTVVKVEEGKGNEKGLAILVIECENGKRVRMRPAFPFSVRREWFLKPETILGKKVTYQYQTISDYGVPIHPVMKAVRDYE
ncbi:MAG: hypothetical protein KatS3mg101_0915 [Patescibacteria group bacterium]|nr:MAG: hypothetical protein KatS3mg101_0915 [Patescibacteria group bacterium]